MPCHIAPPHHAHARYSPDRWVTWYYSGFAALWRQVTSHCACPLHMPGRSTLHCRRPALSMCCMHLMPAIRCVWLVTYAFNALPAPRAWQAMMDLMSGIMGMDGHARGMRATGHVAAPEPSHTRRWVWSHRTLHGTKAQSSGGSGASVTWRR
jgi:hypothetical protein